MFTRSLLVVILLGILVPAEDADAFSITCGREARPDGLAVPPNPTLVSTASWTVAEAGFVSFGLHLTTAGGPGGISAVRSSQFGIIGRFVTRFHKQFIATYPGPGVYSIASQATAWMVYSTIGTTIRYDLEQCGFAGPI